MLLPNVGCRQQVALLDLLHSYVAAVAVLRRDVPESKSTRV